MIMASLQKAVNLKRMGDYQEALYVYQGIHEADCTPQELVNLCYGKGKIFYILEKYRDSYNEFLKCGILEIKNRSVDFNTYTNLGYSYYAEKVSQRNADIGLEQYLGSIAEHRAVIDPYYANEIGFIPNSSRITERHGAATSLAFFVLSQDPNFSPIISIIEEKYKEHNANFEALGGITLVLQGDSLKIKE